MIIGISGKLGSGKSTVAKLVADFLGYEIFSFGRAVKEETAQTFGFPVELCYTQDGKVTEITNDLVIETFKRPMLVRELLQVYGTDITRAKDDLYWVKKADPTKNLVIDDVRFQNEVDFCKENGQVFRVEHFRCQECEGVLAHASETALDNYFGWNGIYQPRFGELRGTAFAILGTLRYAGLWR